MTFEKKPQNRDIFWRKDPKIFNQGGPLGEEKKPKFLAKRFKNPRKKGRQKKWSPNPQPPTTRESLPQGENGEEKFNGLFSSFSLHDREKKKRRRILEEDEELKNEDASNEKERNQVFFLSQIFFTLGRESLIKN